MLKKSSFILACALASTLAQANTDPTEAILHVYGMAVSTNTDCSNATVVGYNASGTDFDFTQGPTLFSGSIAAGTYQCVILYMDAKLTFIPKATVGSCTAGTTYTINIGHNGTFTPGSPNSSNVLVYSANTANTGTSSTDLVHVDKVLLFLSTGSTGTGQTGGAFLQPTTATPTNGITLGAPFVVSSTGTSGTFVVNFNGQVNGGGGNCDLGPPTFTFR